MVRTHLHRRRVVFLSLLAVVLLGAAVVGSRRPLSSAGNLTLVLLTGQPGNPFVSVGRKGWLFGVPTHKRTLFTLAELEGWRQYLETRDAWFRAHEMTYVVMIVPEKQTLYPEFVTEHRALLPARGTQLVEYLRTRSALRIVYPLDRLRETKRKEPVYSISDTHWTSAGAEATSRELAATVPELFPAPTAPEDLVHVRVPAAHDLRKILGWTRIWLPDETLPLPRSGPHTVERTSEAPNAVGRWVTESDDASLPRALVFHDSFFIGLAPYFTSRFSRATMVHRTSNGAMDREEISAARPALVLDEWAERRLFEPVPTTEDWLTQ